LQRLPPEKHAIVHGIVAADGAIGVLRGECPKHRDLPLVMCQR
jgi:hypothetical protein